MIYSSIYAGGAGQYPAAIQRALDYLKTTDITALEPANYPIEGDLMFAKVFDRPDDKELAPYWKQLEQL